MGVFVQWLDKNCYSAYDRNWDDQMFRERILSRLTEDMVVLDLGAGAGIVEQMNFRGKARRVCGIDPDPRVCENPYLDEGKEATGESIPYPGEYFDLVLADNVFEHLERPAEVLNEVARVLKPGGRLLFKTPNKYHYMPLIARLTPHRFHQFINRLRGRESEDTFPTRYAINTPRDVDRYAAESGLQVHGIELIEGRPEYLRLSALTYVAGLLYERMVNAVGVLSRFRILIIAELVKPAR